MTVTSIATLQLLPGIKPTDPDLKAVLLEATRVMEAASNDLAGNVLANFPSHNETHIPDAEMPLPPTSTSPRFHVYAQHEDPSILYILGAWPSRSLHMNGFVRTAANGAVVASLKPFVAFGASAVHHVSLDAARIPTDAPVLVIRHHAVGAANLAAFEAAVDAAAAHLAHVSARPIASGWQVERAEGGGTGSDVFVLFSGWDDLGHHREFQESGRAEEYERVREWIDEGGLEVRHAVKVELE